MTQEIPQNNQNRSLGCLPYAIGGCSFIPLLGVVFGLVVIAWGIIKIKDGGWKLVILGCAGIFFTILLYGSLLYFGLVQNGGIYDELRTKMAEQNIRTLAKNIEFYKIMHGHYPNSLVELEKDAAQLDRIFMVDPIIKRPLTGFQDLQPKFFYYQLEPDHQHYYLLSVGPDGKPFTADDITPKFSLEELKNMGLKIHQ